MLALDLSQDLAFGLDPALVAHEMGLDPDPWQESSSARRPAGRSSTARRQSGKSTVTALLAAHTALYDPGSLTLLLSPTQRQSHELFRKALDAYRAIPTAIPIVQESALRLELSNGSRIVSLPGKEKTVRGFSGVRLLAWTRPPGCPTSCTSRSARCSPSLGAVWSPSRRRSGPGGGGTRPGGSEEPWERYEVPAAECPRISGGVPRGGAAGDGRVVVRPGVRMRVPGRRDPALRPGGRGAGLRGGGRGVGAVDGLRPGSLRPWAGLGGPLGPGAARRAPPCPGPFRASGGLPSPGRTGWAF